MSQPALRHEGSGAPRLDASVRSAIFLLFLASGFAGLAYQVVWVRMLTTVFGVTAYAIATVLASFMAGLALGSYAFGRFIDRHPRPLRIYALLELGIGVWALLVPAFLGIAERLFVVLHGPSTDGSLLLQNLIRVPLTFLVLVLPTTFMGATLPILCKYFIDTLDRVGRETGRLYFVNTIGAVAGCATAGFLLVPGWGLRTTTVIAAALNLLVGAVALLLDRIARRPTPAHTPDPATVPGRRAETAASRWVLGAFALSGFAALVFEVIWSRVLILVFGSTVYSFSAMLTVFLLGLALGGALFGKLVDRSGSPLRLLGFIQAAIALVILLETAVINHLPVLFLVLLRAGDLQSSALMLVKFALSFVILFPAALLFGGTFPIVAKLYTDSLAATGRSIGTVYAMNTVGAILGSIFGGFVLLPWLGLRGSLLAIAGLLLAVGFVTLVVPYERSRPQWRAAAAAAGVFVVALAVLPRWNTKQFALGVYYQPGDFIGANGRIQLDRILRERETLYYAEGLNDTIIVYQTPSERSLSINGKSIATSAWQDVLHLKMLGHLPVLLHPGAPRTAVNIGLGIGGTISGLASHPLERVDVVELESAVPPATRLFADVNDAVLDNPRLRLLLNDGRTHLALTDERYDIISSDPFEPFITGAGNLYSLEFFELGRDRLAPGGLMTQWVPLHQLGDREFRSLLGTFARVFPHYTVWFTGESVILIGSADPQRFDPTLVATKIREGDGTGWLTRLGVEAPEKLASFLLGDETTLANYAAGVPLNTDSHPIVEYGSARQMYDQTIGPNLTGLAAHALDADGVLAYFRTTAGPDTFDPARARALLAVNRLGIEGIIDAYAGELDRAIDKLTQAVAVSHDPFLTNWLALTHEQYGLIAQRNQDLGNAVAHFEHALALQPERPISMVNLGYLYHAIGRPEAALELLNRAYRLHPGDPALVLRLAFVHQALGHTDDAERLFEATVAIDPRSPAALATLGAFRLQEGNLAEAERLFRDSLAEDDANLGAREMLSQTLLHQGQAEAAREQCEAILERAPQAAVGHLCLGEVAMFTNDAAGAEREYGLAATLAPEDPEVHFRLARAYATQQRMELAAQSLQRALALGGPSYGARAAADRVLQSLVEVTGEPAPTGAPSGS